MQLSCLQIVMCEKQYVAEVEIVWKFHRIHVTVRVLSGETVVHLLRCYSGRLGESFEIPIELVEDEDKDE